MGAPFKDPEAPGRLSMSGDARAKARWALNAEHVAERAHVIAPLRESPRLLWSSVTPAVATVVQVR